MLTCFAVLCLTALPDHCCCLQATSTQQARNATLTVTGAVSWRRPGLKYNSNEVFLDIVEEVNLLLSNTGELDG
jgi:hypothetical protein